MTNGSSLEMSHIRKEINFGMGIIQGHDSIGRFAVDDFSGELSSGYSGVFRKWGGIGRAGTKVGKEQQENEAVTA